MTRYYAKIEYFAFNRRDLKNILQLTHNAIRQQNVSVVQNANQYLVDEHGIEHQTRDIGKGICETNIEICPKESQSFFSIDWDDLDIV